MNIHEARQEVAMLESKSLQLRNLIKKHDDAAVVLTALEALPTIGRLELIGKSGRIGDNNLIMSISINQIGGCVAVPELVRSLAKEKIKAIEANLQRLAHYRGWNFKETP